MISVLLTDGRVQKKGTQFNNWRTVSTIEAAIRLHSARNVDEILLLDVTASAEGRVVSSDLVRRLATSTSVPFSVGGGAQSLRDVERLLREGADRVLVGSAGRVDPERLRPLVATFGSQAILAAIDTVWRDNNLHVRHESPFTPAEAGAVDLARRLARAGVGEILINSVERDGLMCGVDSRAIELIARHVSVPLIACGGVRDAGDLLAAAGAGASAVGVGALFQFTQTTPSGLREEARALGVDTRLC